jgi:hypothetical protein
MEGVKGRNRLVLAATQRAPRNWTEFGKSSKLEIRNSKQIQMNKKYKVPNKRVYGEKKGRIIHRRGAEDTEKKNR